MSKFVFSFAVIVFGLTLGYLIQNLSNKGRIHLPLELDALRKLLQKIALLFFMPVTVLCAIWIVNVESVSIAALPFIGFGAILLGGLFALLFARILKLENRKTGALFACGSFTNIGAIGALVCFIFLGERGFALVPIYKIFEEVTYYGIGFPIAKYFSTADSVKEHSLDRVKGLLRDPFIQVALSSITIGGMLNIFDVPRPEFFRTVNAVFIPVGTSLLLISIGLAMKFRSVKNYMRECISVSLIKFFIVPVTMSSAAFMIGYGGLEDGLPLKVVMILTCMPVAFNALIPPSIYDLDLDLANACWFFTTASLVVVLPVLLSLISLV
jgi:predicted permease